METRVLTATDPLRDEAAVREAAQAIAAGKLVVFPTETVYGIAAAATSADAVAALSALKNRPPDKPFTLHLGSSAEAARYAGPLSALAQRLVSKAWPGPLTLVVPDRRPRRGEPAGLVEDAIYCRGTVGLRCPAHAVGRAILRAAGVPVVGSSANLGGRDAPRRADEALASLAGKVPLVIDSGPTQYARASTVVRIREDETYEVLREEAVTARRLARLARTRILFVCTGNICRSPMAAGIAARTLADRFGCDPAMLPGHGIDVQSAGTGAAAGFPASDHAILAMQERGIDIALHQSRPITVDAILAADYIWVMTRGHLEAVRQMAPEAAGRIALLDPAGEDVADPIGGDLEAYRACARRLEKAVAARLTETPL